MINLDYQESAPTAAGGDIRAITPQSMADNNTAPPACKLKKIYLQLSFDFVEECAVSQRGGI